MSGSHVIDTQATYASMISMGVIPREVYNKPGEQETTKTGVKKWVAGVAVSYNMDPIIGMVSPAEVLNVTIASESDPGMSCPPGTPVVLEGLRSGISAPEQRPNRDGSGMRVVGGKPFYSAVAVRPAAAAWSKKADAA